MLVLIETVNEHAKFLLSATDYKVLAQKVEDIFSGIKAEIREDTIVLTGVEKLKKEYKDAFEQGMMIIDPAAEDYFEFKEDESFTFKFKIINSLEEVEKLVSKGVELEDCL